ncbi:SDR family oxidoreductase [Cytophagaceae bacterium YF14B1]|uniref:SDR family oxidoreductase n=1 Tax=Xanthocytophaga flava TaxID=3048013 RepID=A0AAE3QZG6_9BACT|nr:SDR family oxidoreductase [Xanthocytophaga flavus]MDJ1486041.1 SDR family oxidoreductase [Xanthocytophaga flavus]
MDLHLNKKTAIVSGASQGIGRAITRELALEGVKVLATARNEALLNDLKSDIIASGGTEPVLLVQDFVDKEAPQRIAKAALDNLGQVDILINNAGRSRPVPLTGQEEDWIAAMTLDFEQHRKLTHLLIPHFIERKQGAILNLTSTYELRQLNVSAIAKAAVTAWSKQLAGELGKYGIRVNCLQPGLIDTNNIRPYFPGEERQRFAEQAIPLGDFGEPQDMANMAVFLVSPRARYVTGTVAVVDGGMRNYAF